MTWEFLLQRHFASKNTDTLWRDVTWRCCKNFCVLYFRHLAHQTFCLRSRHFANQTFCPPDIMTIGHFVQQTFCSPDILSPIHLAHQTFCQLDILPRHIFELQTCYLPDFCHRIFYSLNIKIFWGIKSGGQNENRLKSFLESM